MWRTLAITLLPFLKPIIFKVIETLVLYMEDKFKNHPKSGIIKKSAVVKEVQEYLELNPEVKEDLKKTAKDGIDKEIDKLIEEAVKKIKK